MAEQKSPNDLIAGWRDVGGSVADNFEHLSIEERTKINDKARWAELTRLLSEMKSIAASAPVIQSIQEDDWQVIDDYQPSLNDTHSIPKVSIDPSTFFTPKEVKKAMHHAQNDCIPKANGEQVSKTRVMSLGD